jgi:DNA helicase-2/ATP-dependent DNA helicase PcrA
MKDSEKKFGEEYKKLNPEQKKAVDTIDGPVMVVAGPGTGKTQILALRIANILTKTDTKADSILCLTFTNSAVAAMRERLTRYIGEVANKINISTFHGFGLEIIEKYFQVLGLQEPPRLLDESESAGFFDEILENGNWEFLRPRGDRARYFKDLKSIASLLARERINASDFAAAVDKEIKIFTENVDNISTRGESKGKLKQEAVKQIESLEKSREVARFLEVYEKRKKEKNMIDYDDVLESLVRIVEISEEALAYIQEQYLYVLVDEHQDSSRVQNEFLSCAWGTVERPNIFVVGDDRQLIYGFAGASIDHFKGFQKTFPEAELIPLLHNYRSTQIILDAAHALLPSVLSDGKLVSHKDEAYPIRLVEAPTPYGEIFAAGMAMKDKISSGLSPSDCALLVPKNSQARAALQILHDMGLPIALGESLNLFDQKEAHAFLRILKIIATGDTPALARSFFDDISGIPPLEAHTFLSKIKMRDFSLNAALGTTAPLFGENYAGRWLAQLASWQKDAKENTAENNLPALLEHIGQEISGRKNNGGLVPMEDIVATFSALLAKRSESSIAEFVAYLEKLVEYGEDIPLIAKEKNGVRVLTMHSAKGLEFEFVWIAHMDERSLGGGRRWGFALPESILSKIEERDIDAIKRKLYVAITRAKHFCALSYSSSSKQGREQELAKIIAELPAEVFEKEKAAQSGEIKEAQRFTELKKLVTEQYAERYNTAALLNSFFECPWQWYFRNLLGLPEPENENLIFGSLVHAGIDNVIKTNKIILPQTILENAKVAEVVKAWAERRLSHIEKSRENEYPISVADKKFPHLKMYGRIDLLEKLPEGTLRVTDFKTGGVRKKSEIEKLDEEGRMSNNLRQLAMYSYLIRQSPKWKEDVTHSRLEFVESKDPKAMFYDTAISHEQIDLLVKDIGDYDSLVKTGEWLHRPCNYNSYGKNTECEYCKMAEIYKS